MSDLWKIPREPDLSNPFSSPLADGPHHSPNLEPGSRVGDRFLVRELLGIGSSGTVYRVTDLNQDREIALKIMHAVLTDTALAIEAFLKEAKLSISLKHPDILRVFDALDLQERKALTMELLSGGTLRQQMQGPSVLFTPEQAARIILPTTQALSYAHNTTIHCDIKPENIGISSDGKIKLMDFGIAKLKQKQSASSLRSTITQYRAGTPYYMAPEQIRTPEKIDARVDQYSLGVVLYELLCGYPPLGVALPLSQRRRDLPLRLTRSVDRALNESPDERYPDIDAMAEELDRGFNQARHPVMARLTSTQSQTRIKRALITLACLVGFVILFNLVRERGQQEAAKSAALRTEVAAMEMLHSAITQWTDEKNRLREQAEERLTAIDPNNPVPWLQASNHLETARLVMGKERGYSEGHRSETALRDQFTRVHRLLAYGYLGSAEGEIHSLKTKLTQREKWLDHAEILVEEKLKAEALLASAAALESFPDAMPLDHLSAQLAKADQAESSGRYDEAVEKRRSVSRQLGTQLQSAYEESQHAASQAQRRWTEYYPDLSPQALSFIADPEAKVEEAKTWHSLYRFDRAIQQLNQATDIYERWSDDMAALWKRTESSWQALDDKIEIPIGMRFVRVDGNYLSVWETRVVDFARYISELPAEATKAQNTWKAPGYPLSPVSPVVGIPRASALSFGHWLQTQFPNHIADTGLPSVASEPARNGQAELTALYGPRFSILVDPHQWNSNHFREHYQDNSWSPEQYVTAVASGRPNRLGIYDLDGNVWEWQANDYHYPHSRPSADKFYPILRGGAAGTTTYQRHEPLDPHMSFILRKEFIGFRVSVGVVPKRQEIY